MVPFPQLWNHPIARSPAGRRQGLKRLASLHLSGHGRNASPRWTWRLRRVFFSWFRNPASSPVEVGGLSHCWQGFSTLPGGLPWECLGIYEPSTVCFLISKCFIIFLKSRNLREQKSSYLAILRTWPFLAIVKTWPELKGRWCPPTIGDQKVTNWITWWWVFPSLDLLKMLGDARNKFKKIPNGGFTTVESLKKMPY